MVLGRFWEGFGRVLASKLARKFEKNRKMRDPGGSRGPLEFRAFLALNFEVYGVPFGCQLGCILRPKTAPRRARGRKKGHKNDEKSRFMLGAAQEEGYPIGPWPKNRWGTPPGLGFSTIFLMDFRRFWHRIWKVFGPSIRSKDASIF